MISFNDNRIKQERCLLDENEIFFYTIKNITDMEKPSVKNPRTDINTHFALPVRWTNNMKVSQLIFFFFFYTSLQI